MEINSVDDIADYWRQTDMRESSQNTRNWGFKQEAGWTVVRGSDQPVRRATLAQGHSTRFGEVCLRIFGCAGRRP